MSLLQAGRGSRSLLAVIVAVLLRLQLLFLGAVLLRGAHSIKEAQLRKKRREVSHFQSDVF